MSKIKRVNEASSILKYLPEEMSIFSFCFLHSGCAYLELRCLLVLLNLKPNTSWVQSTNFVIRPGGAKIPNAQPGKYLKLLANWEGIKKLKKGREGIWFGWDFGPPCIRLPCITTTQRQIQSLGPMYFLSRMFHRQLVVRVVKIGGEGDLTDWKMEQTWKFWM